MKMDKEITNLLQKAYFKEKSGKLKIKKIRKILKPYIKMDKKSCIV